MSRRIRGASPFDYEPRAAPDSPGEMGQPQVERFRTAACELKTRNSQAAFDAIVRRVAVQPFDTGTGRSIASGVARENGLTPHDKIDLIEYYYFEKAEGEIVMSLFEKKNVLIYDIKDFWDKTTSS